MATIPNYYEGEKPLKRWVPPVLIDVYRRAKTQARFRSWGKAELLEPNRKLVGTKTGKRCFLIATGPSLKQEDLSKLKGEDVFSVSNFFLHPEAPGLNPLFHSFAPYHEPLVRENYIDWLRQADQQLPKSTGMVLGHTTEPMVREAGLFKNRPVHYLYLDIFPSAGRLDLTQPILQPLSGPLLLVPVLFAMGYSEIYLLGIDHTQIRNYKQTVSHFYETGKDPRQNASDTASWLDKNIQDELHYLNETFEQYQFYRKRFGKLGGQGDSEIINLSQDSYLDFLPSARLSEVIHGKR